MLATRALWESAAFELLVLELDRDLALCVQIRAFLLGRVEVTEVELAQLPRDCSAAMAALGDFELSQKEAIARKYRDVILQAIL